MKNNVYKIGFFGASKILESQMARAFNKHSGFQITAIASKTQSRLSLLSRQYKCRGFSNYNDLIKLGELEAAYISLPNHLHAPVTAKLLAKGIHCLVEKPITTSISEYKNLENLAKLNNAALVENFQFQYHSQFKFIESLINSGSLGDLRSINIRFGFPLLNDKNNIRYIKSLNGGATYDAGAYIAKIASLFLDDDSFCVSSNHGFLKGFEVDMFGSCIINNHVGKSVLGSWGFDNEYSCLFDAWLSKGNIRCDRIFSPKPSFDSKLQIVNNSKYTEYFFRDDAYYNSVLNFYKIIQSNKQKDLHHQMNNIQTKLLSLISDF